MSFFSYTFDRGHIYRTVLCPKTKAHWFNNIFHITITTVSFVYQVQSYFVEVCQVQVLRNPLLSSTCNEKGLTYKCHVHLFCKSVPIPFPKDGEDNIFRAIPISMNVPRGQTLLKWPISWLDWTDQCCSICRLSSHQTLDRSVTSSQGLAVRTEV